MANIYMFLTAASAGMLGRLDSNLARRLQNVLIRTVADTFLIGWAKQAAVHPITHDSIQCSPLLLKDLADMHIRTHAVTISKTKK